MVWTVIAKDEKDRQANIILKDDVSRALYEHISGIIDVDWIGMGDVLTFAALTHVALLNMGYDTDYMSFILDEMDADDIQRKSVNNSV